jgi:hypothetical protein
MKNLSKIIEIGRIIVKYSAIIGVLIATINFAVSELEKLNTDAK